MESKQTNSLKEQYQGKYYNNKEIKLVVYVFKDSHYKMMIKIQVKLDQLLNLNQLTIRKLTNFIILDQISTNFLKAKYQSY